MSSTMVNALTLGHWAAPRCARSCKPFHHFTSRPVAPGSTLLPGDAATGEEATGAIITTGSETVGMMSDGATVRAIVVMSGSGTEMSDAIAIGVTEAVDEPSPKEME